MLADLHTHSTASDGQLTPQALVERAARHGVTHLAITDHDSIAAYAELPSQAGALPLVLVPGIEFSSQWRGIGIHVVGLNIDLASAALRDAVGRQLDVREQRAVRIAARLEKKGIDNPLSAARALAGHGTIGRPHFAQHLVDIGKVRTVRDAFRKYLGAGKPGDVRNLWPELAEVVGWIRAAGGVAVLAHPSHYRMTATKLRALIADFRDAGGAAIEVVSGRQDRAVTGRLADYADKFGLHASTGSDFHGPGAAWAELGSAGPLPASCRPVWDLWQGRNA